MEPFQAAIATPLHWTYYVPPSSPPAPWMLPSAYSILPLKRSLFLSRSKRQFSIPSSGCTYDIVGCSTTEGNEKSSDCLNTRASAPYVHVWDPEQGRTSRQALIDGK